MPLYNPAGGGALRQVAPGAYNPGGAATASNVLTPGLGEFGAWVQIVAALGSDDILVGVSIQHRGNVTGTFAFTLQIGVGGAGAEVVQTSVSGSHQYRTSAGFGQSCYIPLVYPLKIAAGTRIAVRMADNTGAGDSYSVALNNIPQSAVVAY